MFSKVNYYKGTNYATGKSFYYIDNKVTIGDALKIFSKNEHVFLNNCTLDTIDEASGRKYSASCIKTPYDATLTLIVLEYLSADEFMKAIGSHIFDIRFTSIRAGLIHKRVFVYVENDDQVLETLCGNPNGNLIFAKDVFCSGIIRVATEFHRTETARLLSSLTVEEMAKARETGFVDVSVKGIRFEEALSPQEQIDKIMEEQLETYVQGLIEKLLIHTKSNSMLLDTTFELARLKTERNAHAVARALAKQLDANKILISWADEYIISYAY